ncbi:tetratricopeptide repeat protein [Myxococcota bacterium]|nr:tetratricopeptide repeat protein [Myxococcota bacterium]MBU1381866.1 tetratricopeptide repeat protein [Myxococcota bacterium]MBU1495601.1 tetratricopeptide repeat protein [Myxococcota bacterium]
MLQFWILSLIINISAGKPDIDDYASKSAGDVFKDGVKHYVQAKTPADYAQSANAFEHLISRNIRHEDLYFNLANSYYKAGLYGHAVFNYERALKIYPGHKDAAYNLKLARQVIQSRFKDNIISFAGSSLWIKIVTMMSYSTMKVIFAVFWVLLFTILSLLYFRESGLLRISMITATVIIGVCVFISGLMLSGRWYYETSRRFGIVLPDEISVHEAPQKSSNAAFKIHAGLKIRISSEDEAWIKITLPNGMEGWVEKSTIGIL